MNNPKVSIIIPVYNAEKYLDECIESVLAQTYKDFEIILVNDGSQDRSQAICNNYVASHNNIRLINQHNGGSNYARKTGLKQSNGEWACFVDADDTMPANALSLLMAESNETELVVGAVDKPTCFFENFTLKQFREYVISGIISPSMCAKLYKRNIITEYVFDIPKEICYGEDMLFFIRVAFSITAPPRICNSVVYYYRRNEISISHGHKSSLDYEALFDEYRIKSIPKEELTYYMGNVIKNKLNGLIGTAYSSPNQLVKSEHKYINQLKQQILEYHYEPSFKERIILYSKFPFIIRIVAFFSLAMTSMRYRLKL